MSLRVGFGFDVHRLDEGQPFFIGGIKIPHTGWNAVNLSKVNSQLSNPKKLFSEIQDNSNFYFTHSFAVTTSNKNETWAKNWCEKCKN